MSERTKARTRLGVRGRAALLSRWSLPALLAFVCVAAILVLNAAAPYLFKGATLESEVAAQLRATAGLEFSAGVSGRFDLLPRPHVVFYKMHVSDPAGTLKVDAEEFDGDVRLLPLIVGRVELTSATLYRPRLAFDLDSRPIRPDSLIGRAIYAREPVASQETQRLGTVTLIDGAATINSRSARIPALEAVNVTLDWRDLDSPATLTGSLSLRGMSADIAAWIAQPASLIRGDHSAMTLNIHSAPLDFSATGDLASAAATTFRGHITTKAPAGAAFLAALGSSTKLIAPFANLSLNSDASLSVDSDGRSSVDLPKLTLRADGNEYEGTLAFQGGPRPSLSGTLASEQLMLAPFLTRLPSLLDPERRWSRVPIVGQPPRVIDLDLRVSATHVRMSPITVDDAALAIMTRGDRTDIALVEGKAYGGALKGRMSIGVSADGISLRGTSSIAGADASALTWDVFGRQLAAGTMSGSLSLETLGDSPVTLMRGIQGWAKGSVLDGEISGADLVRALRELGNGRPAAVSTALRSGRTPFRTLVFGTHVYDGVATFDEGTIQSPDADLSVGGSADLGDRSLDLRALAKPSAATPARPHLGFAIGGSFDKLRISPEVAGAPPTELLKNAPSGTR